MRASSRLAIAAVSVISKTSCWGSMCARPISVRIQSRKPASVSERPEMLTCSRVGVVAAGRGLRPDLAEQLDGLADDPAVDRADHAAALGHRQERARQDHVAVAADHPQQQLVVRDLPAVEVDDRLGVHLEALLVERAADAIGP